MKIVFVLPNAGTSPIGGFKVVYEYANRLSRRGHQITVVHGAFERVDTPFNEWPRRALYYLQYRLRGDYGPRRWFKTDPSVSLRWVPTLIARHVPDADIVIATSWETAEWVNRYPATKGKKIYLLQGLETWLGSEGRVSATWKMPLEKIVIAGWLRQIADDFNERSVLIPNGLDFEQFKMNVRSEDRNPKQLMMLYHTNDWKGSADGLRAIDIVKVEIPEICVSLFGVYGRPSGLPAWIEYQQNPPQSELRGLYNRAAIFLAPSWTEGWGLTPSEAMMCGAAVAATDIGGHREFAFHEKTALLSPPKNPEALAANIIRLIRDNELRIKIARQGNEYIQRFTWDKAVELFEAALIGK